MIRRIVYNQPNIIQMQDNKLSLGVPAGKSVNSSSSRDSLVISDGAHKLKEQLSLFNTLQTINGRSIQKLRAENNVLTLDAGKYYRFPINEGQNIIVAGLGGWSVEVPYDDIARDFNADFTYFTPDLWTVFDRMQLFLTYLNDSSGWYMSQEFTNDEVLEYCDKLNIKPGNWVEINNAGDTSRYYLMENGRMWPPGQIEDARKTFAMRDYREDGCTEDSVLIVNGKEYKMDQNGHFNIPEGEPIIMGYNVVFPKEISENIRARFGIPEPSESENT